VEDAILIQKYLKSRFREPQTDSAVAVVTDNRKHHQMGVFEAFEISEELAISRCKMQISASISMVCRDDGEELWIRCSNRLSYSAEIVPNRL